MLFWSCFKKVWVLLIFIIILVVAFLTYLFSPRLGSVQKLWSWFHILTSAVKRTKGLRLNTSTTSRQVPKQNIDYEDILHHKQYPLKLVDGVVL